MYSSQQSVIEASIASRIAMTGNWVAPFPPISDAMELSLSARLLLPPRMPIFGPIRKPDGLVTQEVYSYKAPWFCVDIGSEVHEIAASFASEARFLMVDIFIKRPID
jgi:hypothetical protein